MACILVLFIGLLLSAWVLNRKRVSGKTRQI